MFIKIEYEKLINQFPKIENPFPKIENHFRNPWKCICQIDDLNAFPKPQNQNAFFSRRV
jgi:hypothetical protein